MTRRWALLITGLLAAVVAVTLVPGSRSAPVSVTTPVRVAADTSTFDPGNIITDDVFFAGQAMTAGEIDAFISVKGASCAVGTDGTPCLKDFRQDTTGRSPDSYCSGYTPAARESAGAIIAKVALSCGVSPRVLLVLLQKEQGLVTTTGGSRLSATRYAKATGFACPDTAACDTTYAGFQNQVYMAARQYQVYAANPTRYAYRAGRTVNVLFNPSSACGSAPVTIANQATAGLYIYTPYQPNGAALAAGYGSGDGCSAYGNRNFWLYFTDWFGSTQYDAAAATLPKGRLDSVSSNFGQLTLTGWTFDPDGPAEALQVHVYVDGSPVVATTANLVRPDIASSYPAAGAAHGYSVTVPAEIGTRTACAYAINVGAGRTNPQLGCVAVDNQDAGMPRGSFDSATSVPGAIDVSGWTFDPDTDAAVTVRAYVDGAFAQDFPAVSNRTDVAAAFGVGNAHGFEARVPVSPGDRSICLYALNIGAGTHHGVLGCRSVRVPDPAAFNPVGSWDVLSVGGGTARLTGWAVDPDAPTSPAAVSVTVDGQSVAVAGGVARPDVAAAVSGAGDGQGFSWSSVLPPGNHTICLKIQNTGFGTSDLSLGCRSVATVDGAAAAPLGFLDAATAGRGVVSLSGWSFDPDDPAAPATVHIYVDGAFSTAVRADAIRQDVGRAYPQAGASHGLSWTGPVPAGQHQVCVYALNVGAGVNRALGCATVVVADPSVPQGSLDEVTPGASSLSIRGWAFDADVPTQALAVHVYVDGRGTALSADQPRPDVGSTFPGVGDAHGFVATIAATSGPHTVCVYAINIGAGVENPQLGCRVVRVG